MRRLITVVFAALVMSLLVRARSAHAQDQFNVNTNPAPTSCTATYDGVTEKLREQEAQAEAQFRKDNLDCQSKSDSAAKAACSDAATKKYRAVQLELQKGQIDADADRQICDNHKRLAGARAFNARNKPDPCQHQHDQTNGGLSDQDILAEAQFRKDNLDCQSRSDSTAKNDCSDASTKKYRAVQLEVSKGQIDADTNRTVCEDRKRLAKSETESPANGKPPALPEVPNAAPTASTRLSGGVAESGPLPGAKASTANNSPPSGEPLKGLKADVPKLAPVSGPVPMKPLRGAINKNVGNPANPSSRKPASANIAKNPTSGAPGAAAQNPGSGSGGAAGPAAGHSPLYYLNNALNDAVARTNGSRALQQTGQAAAQVDKTINAGLNDTAQKMKAVRDSMANEMVKKWTTPMSPQEAAGEVLSAWANNAAGAGVGAGAGTLIQGGGLKTALSSAASATAKEGLVTAGAGKAIGAGAGAFASRDAKPGEGPNESGAGGNEAPGPGEYKPVAFSEDAPPSVGRTITKFESGQVGQSIKRITSETFKGKTWQGVINEVGREGGGWRPAGPGKWITKNGKWTASESIPEPIDPANPNKVPMIFIENVDGGVIRVKPMGVPQGNLPSMQGPHYALYEKIDPNGGTGWDNEAFKVVKGTPLPKSPAQIEPPPNMPKYSQLGQNWIEENSGKPFPQGDPRSYYSDAFNQYLEQTGWVNAAHQPLADGFPSWNPDMFANLMSSLSR